MHPEKRPVRVALVGAEIQENMALRYLAASLEAADCKTRIIAFNRPDNARRAVNETMRFRPDLVGLSMIFTARAREFCDLAQSLRAAGFKGHITAGGHFASFNAERLLAECPALSSIVHGEGEGAIATLAGSLQAPESVPNLTVRTTSGTARTRFEVIDGELDDLPFPKRIEPFQEYLGVKIANVIGSRGCYGSCSFCSIAAWHREFTTKRFRMRSVENITREMRGLHCRGVRIFNFHDDNFFPASKPACFTRFGEMKDKFAAAGMANIGIAIKARSDSVDPEIMGLLREIGLFRVFVGIETNAVHGLETLNRRLRKEDNLRAIEVLNALDIHSCFNALIFDPETTPGDFAENLDFLRTHTVNPYNFCRTEIYSGTPLEAKLRAEGRLLGDSFGYDYRISDPRMELLFDICNRAFHQRNFADDGLHHAAMSADYEFHILRHFRPREAAGLREGVKSLVARINLDTYGHLSKAYEFAVKADPGDQRSIRAFTDGLSQVIDSSGFTLGAEAREILRSIRERSSHGILKMVGRTAAAAAVAGIILGGVCAAGAQEEMERIAEPSRPVHAGGPLVSSAEFAAIITLYDNVSTDGHHTAEERKAALAELDTGIKSLEQKRVIGRWARRFFESEFTALFDALEGNEPAKMTEADRIALFWKEVDFLHEGFSTLARTKDADTWLWGLLDGRCRRAFALAKGTAFATRLETLSIDRAKYADKLGRMFVARYEFITSNLGNSGVATATRKSPIGDAKNPPAGLRLRHGNERIAVDLASKVSKTIFEDDFIEWTGKEELRLTLEDGRYIIIEPEAVLTGWELEPQIPADLKDKVAQLIKDLGNDDFEVREKATEELTKIGKTALPALKEALNSTDPEVRFRAEEIINKIMPKAPEPPPEDPGLEREMAPRPPEIRRPPAK